MVTRDGLSCPVGHYAINPVPRTAIFREAALARREAGMPELPLRIEISIPSGLTAITAPNRNAAVILICMGW